MRLVPRPACGYVPIAVADDTPFVTSNSINATSVKPFVASVVFKYLVAATYFLEPRFKTLKSVPCLLPIMSRL